MRKIAAGIMAVVFSLGLFAACGGPPKQAEVPDVDKGTGVDMAGEESAPAPKGSASPDAPLEAEVAEMHTKCCASCQQGLAKDRTGADPKTIPCADFTDVLSPWCLEHFRSKPTMAADCK